MIFRVLAINPGSTSTKAALYEDDKAVLELTLRHSVEEIGRFPSINDQLEWRRDLILNALEEKGYKVTDLSAVIGRGGLIKPIEGGVYEVNEQLKNDLLNAERHHASNLGGLIAEELARIAGVKAYIADPVVVDEMIPEARYSGLPECPRVSIFHALNQKATARIYAKQVGKHYEDLNLIVAHMGGGISVSAHRKGRVIDTNNALTGDGPFSPERAGSLPADELLALCFSGKYSKAELLRMIAGKGGLVAHLGTSSVQEICEVRIEKENDAHARQVMEAMCFSIAKNIGGMATILCGKVDAIILTGGIAYNDYVNVRVKEACEFIAPVHIYPGENELEALSMNALMVLRGEIDPKIYM